MSQALSQFASKDLGVPKGEIKKKKNTHVENKEIMHKAFLFCRVFCLQQRALHDGPHATLRS